MQIGTACRDINRDTLQVKYAKLNMKNRKIYNRANCSKEMILNDVHTMKLYAIIRKGKPTVAGHAGTRTLDNKFP